MPGQLNHGDMIALSTIHASRAICLAQVLREVKWGDWFADTPVNEIISMMSRFGLLIIPSHVQPWRYSYGFHQDLHRKIIVNIVPGTHVLFWHIPQILADWYITLMDKLESQVTIARWLATRPGIFMDQLSKPW
jgi:hypothetical protein